MFSTNMSFATDMPSRWVTDMPSRWVTNISSRWDWVTRCYSVGYRYAIPMGYQHFIPPGLVYEMLFDNDIFSTDMSFATDMPSRWVTNISSLRDWYTRCYLITIYFQPICHLLPICHPDGLPICHPYGIGIRDVI